MRGFDCAEFSLWLKNHLLHLLSVDGRWAMWGRWQNISVAWLLLRLPERKMKHRPNDWNSPGWAVCIDWLSMTIAWTSMNNNVNGHLIYGCLIIQNTEIIRMSSSGYSSWVLKHPLRFLNRSLYSSWLAPGWRCTNTLSQDLGVWELSILH